MVTRLRNPESKLSQLKNQQVAAAVHEANKGFKEGKEVRGKVVDHVYIQFRNLENLLVP